MHDVNQYIEMQIVHYVKVHDKSRHKRLLNITTQRLGENDDFTASNTDGLFHFC